MSTYKELLMKARTILESKQIADANVDAWYLLTHVFGISRSDFYLYGDQEVDEEKQRIYLMLTAQRAEHIPLQFITGTQEFMGLEFEVNENVLIPRQDTQVLVEEVLRVCEDKSILDMCTGSGCIIISLAKLGKPLKATGVDISEKALETATINAKKHKVEIDFIHSNLFDKVKGTYDIIVSNPPYIPSGEINSLMPEVRDHEPIMALDGDFDGLVFYHRILEESSRYLKPEGLIFFEIGHNQGEAVTKILKQKGFYHIRTIKDLSGLDRVVTGIRSKN